MSRCTGHCCESFPIDVEGLTDPDVDALDGDFIRDMLIVLETDGRDDGRWTCTCRHFDGEDCTVYENRPWMCSAFPYGKKCRKEGCTLK